MKLRYDMMVQGVYIVTANHRGKMAGMAASWATQADVNRVAVCMGSQSATRKLVLASRKFGFHVLACGQRALGGRFGSTSSAKADKFKGMKTRKVKTGAPIFGDCRTWFDCRVEKTASAGDHKIIIGRIVAAGHGKRRAAPLVYRQEDY